MAVVDMVDRGHVVIFDSGRSFAYHKQTGMETDFVRREGGWDLTLELEAPELANKVAKDYLAQVTENKQEKEKNVNIIVQSGPLTTTSTTTRTSPPGPFGRQ
jgi:hypothetical protein